MYITQDDDELGYTKQGAEAVEEDEGDEDEDDEEAVTEMKMRKRLEMRAQRSCITRAGRRRRWMRRRHGVLDCVYRSGFVDLYCQDNCSHLIALRMRICERGCATMAGFNNMWNPGTGYVCICTGCPQSVGCLSFYEHWQRTGMSGEIPMSMKLNIKAPPTNGRKQ